MKTWKRWTALAAAVAFLRPGALALTGETWREELDFYAAETPTVVTASLRSQKLDEVPGTMTVVTDKDIRALGLQTLLQVMNLIPGFELTQESFGPLNIVVRGYRFSTGHLKLMIDGHPVNAADHKEVDAWLDMPLDDVKQVEVIRGPGSALYGTDAFVAAVNVITRSEKGAMAALTGGGHGRWGTTASLASGPETPWRYKFSFNQAGERGDTYMYRNDRLSGSALPSLAPASRKKARERTEGGATLGRGDFSVTVRHARNRREWTEGYLNIMTPERSFITNRNDFVEAEVKHPFSDDASLSFKGSYDRDEIVYDGQLAPPYFNWGVGPSFGPEGALFRSWNVGQRYNGQAVGTVAVGRHGLTAGVEYGNLYFPEVRSRRNYDTTTLAPLPGGMGEFGGQDPQNWSLAEHSSEEHWGAFAQDIVDAAPLTLILGARHDHYQMAGSAFSPRVAVVYDAPWRQILKASFGQAFFAPYSSARYTQALGFRGNPNLKPEIVKTWEVSVQNAFAARAHYVLTGFTSHITDGLTFDPSRPVAYSNETDVRYSGFEAEGRWDVLTTVSLWGNYALHKSKAMSLVKTGVFTPDSTVNLGVRGEPARGLSLSVHAHLADDAQRAPKYGGHIAGWGTLNAAVNYKVGKGVEVQLSGQNLLDKEIFSYNDQGFVTGSTLTGGNDFPWPGRQVFLKTTYRWPGR